MLGAFWQAVGTKLADRVAAVSIPSLIFWLAGIAAYTWHRGGLHTLSTQTDWLGHQSAAVQITAIVAALMTIAGSGLLVNWAASPTLRLLEGYWPRCANPLRHRLTSWLASRAETQTAAWQTAYHRVAPPAIPTARDLATYTRLERRRRRHPAAAGYFLPTPIGNILRAAERRPIDKYGLDTIILWPRLWPALPDTTRTDLIAARTALDQAVTTALWGLLSCAFTPWTWLALPIGLAIAAGTVVFVVPARAQVFGDLIEAAYDQHRTALYTQLRWPPPTNPADERTQGRLLTEYLWRGSDDTTPTFTPPP
jgi:hypothetical protein